jgi:hypothetical protein
MRINVSFDDEVYPELAAKLDTVRVKKRSALIVKLASERLCFSEYTERATSQSISYADNNDQESGISLDGYDLSGELDLVLGDIGK